MRPATRPAILVGARVVALILVILPPVVVGLVIETLPPQVDVQWSGDSVTNTHPLWMVLLFTASPVVAAIGFAFAFALDRDATDPHRLGFYLTGGLTSGPSLFFLALIAVNTGRIGHDGAAFLGAIAIGLAYGVIPYALVALAARSRPK
jgi:hypothetical protein